MKPPMSSPVIEIRPVRSAKDRKIFIRLANPIYADDPNYIAPLEYEIGARLDSAKNPALISSPHQLWIAYKNNTPVGRIAAIVNEAHLERHHDGAGHFGFFESIDDQGVIDALFETASAWLRAEGTKKIAGPFNFSVNEECGLLVDGFDTPPYVMMPHGRPYYAEHLERLGFQKAMDMHALKYVPTDPMIPPKRQRFVNRAMSNPHVFIRNIDFKNFASDIRVIIDIFDDAWSDNWGFVPFSEEQIAHMASELRPIIEKYNIVICFYDDEPAAFCLVLPNINELIRDFGGKLLPFNWAKLLWRLKIKHPTQARMPLMGVRKKYHGKPIGAAFAYKLIERAYNANVERGVTSSELSWILETNEAMLAMLIDLGARIYKTYRIYEKPL